MRASFPAGRLTVCPTFLACVPRPAFVAAMVSHFTQPPAEGEISSDHHHDGTRFQIVTAADRTNTRISLS